MAGNMVLTAVAESDLYPWIILPGLIFVAKILDVSLQTLRAPNRMRCVHEG